MNYALKDVTKARAWMLTILTRMFIDVMRRRRRQPDTVPLLFDEEVPEPIPDEAALWQRIGVDDLRAATERLTDDVRDTYRMCALDGRDHATIAQVQQIKITTVGTRIYRARKQLRALLMSAALQEESR